MTSTVPLTVRAASAADEPVLTALARLDSARPLAGRCLLAEVGGRPVAALSVEEGRVVADPFVATREAVAVLKLRAGHAAAPRPHRLRRLTFRLA